MITYNYNSIFTSFSMALVNPVNTLGVMGNGLAKQFKINYPENYKKYVNKCNQGFNIGEIFITTEKSKLILNFPTKTHWQLPSKIEYIQLGLITLKNIIEKYHVMSIAIPALGTGLGNLPWNTVHDLMLTELQYTPSVIEIFSPQ